MRYPDLEDGLTFTQLLECIASFIILILFISFIPNAYICSAVFILSWIFYDIIPSPFNWFMCLSGIWFLIIYVMTWQSLNDLSFSLQMEWNRKIKFEYIYNRLRTEIREWVASKFSEKEDKKE